VEGLNDIAECKHAVLSAVVYCWQNIFDDFGVFDF